MKEVIQHMEEKKRYEQELLKRCKLEELEEKKEKDDLKRKVKEEKKKRD